MSKNVKISNPMKVITGASTRWSYANVWEPKSINGGTPKYSVSLIIPKSDTKTIAKIQAAIEAAYKEGEAKLKGNGKSVPALSVLKTPLRDGDAERPDDEAYKNAYFVNANATSAPGIRFLPAPKCTAAFTAEPASRFMLSTLPATRESPAGSTTCRRSATVNLLAARQALSPTLLLTTMKIFSTKERSAKQWKAQL